MPNTHDNRAEGDRPKRAASPSMLDVERLTALAASQRQNAKYHEAAQTFAQMADYFPNDSLAQYNAGAVFLEADQLDESIARLKCALTLQASVAGYTLYAHVQALRGDNHAARSAFESAIRLAPRDYAAHWGLFEILQMLDEDAAALHHQRIALEERSIHSIDARVAPPRTTLLELCIAGTFQANIPLDFILDLDRTTVHKLYLGVHPIPTLPPYDIVFTTIADASNAAPAIDAAARFIAGQNRPALNAPHLVELTSRDSIALIFANSQRVFVAPTVRATRASAPQHHPAFPFLARPLDSHAGKDLVKIDDADALGVYLQSTADADELHLSAFIDYRNTDGYYRKYRIVFVDGEPYPIHLAISPRWMIHYYNAEMEGNAWMRAEEETFMRDMDAMLGGVLADGLREITRAIPLDYFGIDFSIAADGRILLFEASTAMLVHMRDPVDLYPYKVRYVPRVMRALERLFDKRLGRGACG